MKFKKNIPQHPPQSVARGQPLRVNLIDSQQVVAAIIPNLGFRVLLLAPESAFVSLPHKARP